MEDIFPIVAEDTAEVKQVKEKLNTVYKKSAEHTGKVSDELKAAFATEVKAFITQNTELKAQVTEILSQKAAIEAQIGEHQAALLELNRFRSAKKAAEEKGVKFTDAFSTA